MVRETSAVFADYPEIFECLVLSNSLKSRNYFVNSEGSETVTNTYISYLVITASTYTPENDPYSETIVISVPEKDNLPSLDTLKSYARKLAESILQNSKN